ncbi:MAG: GNAT family N-acetyltransferase [Rhizobiaceae bacterium]|nr:GNAT family N-acetyltransferase [Rhizobiaceae bacterium]
MVGTVGFAAWLSGDALDASFKIPEYHRGGPPRILCLCSRRQRRRRRYGDRSACGRLDRTRTSADHISDLWVDPAFHGSGLGSRLMKHVLAEMDRDAIEYRKFIRLPPIHAQFFCIKNMISSSSGKARNSTMHSASI